MKTDKKASPRFQAQISWSSVIVLLAFTVLWEMLARLGVISKLFFPPPLVIVQTLFKMILSGRLLEHLTVSLGRIGLGIFIGIIFGVPLGIMMGWLPKLRAIFDPLIASLHPIPKIAIFPIILIIFGIGETANIVVIAVSAFFPAVVNSMTGVMHIDPVYFEVAKNYGANRLKTFTRILLPGSLPMVLSGIRLAANTGLLIAIAVELVSAKRGLGVLIWFSWQTLRVEELYATLIVVALLGTLFNVGLKYLSMYLAPWAYDQNVQD
ncbi:MAG: taurine ABC transporter permease [Chloroflexi bacterium HGW-Chloroflexi-6]|nr:MAG: taurine ABC transporter permease [Chloroflexi bacterium HGW-Chloroflexi-6]